MAEAKLRIEFARHGELAAPLWNQIRDPKRRTKPFLPQDFNPYHRKADEPVPLKVPLKMLRKVFVKK
jgi:hypothetical protein